MPELIPSVSAVVAGLELSLVNLSLSSLVTSTSVSSSALIRVVQSEFGASLILRLIRRGQELAESAQDVPNPVHEEWYVHTWSIIRILYTLPVQRLLVLCVYRRKLMTFGWGIHIHGY